MKLSINAVLLFAILVVLLQVSTCEVSSQNGNGGRGGLGRGRGGNGGGRGRGGRGDGGRRDRENDRPGSGRRCRYDFDREIWICRDGRDDDWCVPGRGRDC
ncbi:hypothetical protein BKA69DRAFT_1071941 [Paraphysoderma sedebokerense]|nr:hypothetical protein BKA69DRAFT_1071941 [Paraphysoderma sedebokerense]